jgi:UrcA family protein
MKTIPERKVRCTRLTVQLFAACAVASSIAIATEPGAENEITILAERPVGKMVGRTSSGIPIRLYQLSYTVSYADLDLASEAGAKELKKRVQEAATSACKDLDKLYPQTGTDRSCAREATENSMAQADRLILLAQTQEQSTPE